MPRYRAGYQRSSVTSSTGAISENAVVFQSSGGHTHDGSNSSLIETNSYSVWDFQVNTVYSTTPRANLQNRHIEQFRNFISNHVNNNVLEPAGVVLGENVINATNIISNSITTDVIAANAITTNELATDSIKSLNYSPPTISTNNLYSEAGTFLNLADGELISNTFVIDSSGDGYFKGQLQAAGGSIASFKITSEALLTDGFQSGTTTVLGGDGNSSNTTTTTGAIKIFNYGDVILQSSPTVGPHSGQHTQTEIVGEYINIQDSQSSSYDAWDSNFFFAGTLGNGSSEILGTDEYKTLVRSGRYYSLTLANDNGSVVGARDYTNSTSSYRRADLHAVSGSSYLEVSYDSVYNNDSAASRKVEAYANSSRVGIDLYEGSRDNYDIKVGMDTFGGGRVYIGSFSAPSSMILSIQSDTARIANVFTGNTNKSIISFNESSSSNDPGYIIHETRGTGQTNNGVIHIAPSDDNSFGDYVAIHGTNDGERVRIHTDGQIDGVTTLSATTVAATGLSATTVTATGTVQAEHFYSTDDAQIGDSVEYVYINSDNSEQVQLVSNTDTGRPYIAFYNRKADGTLVRKAYIGFPTAKSDGGAGLNIYPDYGRINMGKTNFTSGNDVSLNAESGYVLIGSVTGSHMAIDSNEIMAKSNGTTATTLYLNNDGGTVRVGSGVLELGTSNVKDLFYGGSGNNAGKRIFIQSSQPSGSNGDIWIKP